MIFSLDLPAVRLLERKKAFYEELQGIGNPSLRDHPHLVSRFNEFGWDLYLTTWKSYFSNADQKLFDELRLMPSGAEVPLVATGQDPAVEAEAAEARVAAEADPMDTS